MKFRVRSKGNFRVRFTMAFESKIGPWFGHKSIGREWGLDWGFKMKFRVAFGSKIGPWFECKSIRSEVESEV